MTDLRRDFGMSIVQVDGHLDVRVSGELDRASAPEFGRRLDSLLTAGDVDLDLADVTFLDSSGLAVLVAARQVRRDGHYRLSVRHPSKPVLRVFELSGLLGVMTSVAGACAQSDG